MNDLLLRRARNGDSAAFEELIAPLEKKIWQLCWHYTRNTADAEDCMQEAMIRIWHGLPGFRAVSELSTWCYSITSRVCLDHLRRARSVVSLDQLREENGFDPPDYADPALIVSEKDEKERTADAIKQLPEEFREALVLTALQGVSVKEAARIAGTTEGTIKSRVSRARDKLRAILWPSGDQKSSEKSS